MLYDYKGKRTLLDKSQQISENSDISSEIPNSILANMYAIKNVDIHSGNPLKLEDDLKSRIEKSIGYKMDNVELRESHDAAAMGAKAFAKGNVVHFAPGQFRPETEQGRDLITHELTHVAQQAQGGIHADVDGLNVNASEHLESMADHGISGANFASPAPLPAMNAEAAPIQGMFGKIKNFFKLRRNEGPAAEPEAAPPNQADEENPTQPIGEAQNDTPDEIAHAAEPSTSDTARIEGANNTKADLRRLPNSGPIQAVLGEDVGKYKSYGVMLAAIDKVNSFINAAEGMEDAVNKGFLPTIKDSLLATYKEAIQAMDNYIKEMSGYAFSDSGKAKRQARREYVSALRDIAMNDLNRLINIQDDVTADQAISKARTTELKDDDFTGNINGGAQNQVYEYKQGIFKPAKEGIGANESSYTDLIGIKHKDEQGNAIDPRLHKREVATSRLDKLLGGGVIVGSKMAKISSDSTKKLNNEQFNGRNFEAAANQEGVLMDKAKGKSFNAYNWNTWGMKQDTQADKQKFTNVFFSSGSQASNGQSNTIGDRLKEQNAELERRTIYGLNKEKSQAQGKKVSNQEGEGVTVNAMDPKFQRDMNALFLMDTLTLQTDRHGGNYFIDADENGYKGLSGIDNDMSFGTENDRAFGKANVSYGGLPKQMLIDKNMAEKIKSVKKPELEMLFCDLLSKEEIDALWDRFQKLSAYIDSLDEDNLIDEWNDETAKKQVMMNGSHGSKSGMDYYTRHILSLHTNFGNVKF